MPKIINRSVMKEHIAVAAWYVLIRDGLKGLSVRTVAAELKVSPGMLRHYFAKQDDLLLFSMELVTRRVRDRLRGVDPSYKSYEKLVYAAHQFLPLDVERTMEMEVWLQFITSSRSHETRGIRAKTQTNIQDYFTELIQQVGKDEHRVVSLSDAKDHALMLHALLDGLTLRYLAIPSEETKHEIITITDCYLECIRKGDLL